MGREGGKRERRLGLKCSHDTIEEKGKEHTGHQGSGDVSRRGLVKYVSWKLTKSNPLFENIFESD